MDSYIQEKILSIVRTQEKAEIYPWVMKPKEILAGHLEEIARICGEEFFGVSDDDVFHAIDRVADINPESKRFYYELGNIYLTTDEVYESVDGFIRTTEEFSALSTEKLAALRKYLFEWIMSRDGEGYCPDTYLSECDDEDIAALLDMVGINH